MTGGFIPTDDLIESSTDGGNKADLGPGGDKFTVDVDKTEIIINLQTDLYASGDVTKLEISPENVDNVEVWVEIDGNWEPVTVETPGGTVTKLSPNDFPLVFTPRMENVTKVKIILTRNDTSEPMAVDVELWACLESGKKQCVNFSWLA